MHACVSFRLSFGHLLAALRDLRSAALAPFVNVVRHLSSCRRAGVASGRLWRRAFPRYERSEEFWSDAFPDATIDSSG